MNRITTSADRDRRKRHGVFYTPEPVARYMAASTLRPVLFESDHPDSLRVLDPACGDGALVWPAYQFLCDEQVKPDVVCRLELIRRHLFGVELDGPAIDRLKQRFRDDLAEGVSSRELNSLNVVLDQNFRCGNAVSGHGWELPETTGAFHWCEQFPDVCRAGGFDVIIANPPYRRERGAKSDREELEHSPLALSRQQARMDLWHYFFHRSLDLLRPGGVLTLIVNSYWTTSEAGRPLIARLAEETTPLEFVLLETAPVFAGVGGRHLIARLRKGITNEQCEILRLREHKQASVLDAELWSTLSDSGRMTSTVSDPADSFARHTVTRDELFRDGKLNLEERRPRPAATQSSSRQTLRLGDLFDVRQGIAENPPRVTRRQALEDVDLRPGEGVFVLSSAELETLKLSAAERELVRPYYSAVEVEKFWQPSAPRQWLLYLTRQTAPDLSALPNIARHLNRFRPILEQRRETRQGKIAWWHLHWPRESRLFEHPRILALQMAKEPRFAYVEAPTYVGFSVNVIVDRTEPTKTDQATNWSLESLAVILNSRRAADWFDVSAKRRGVKLDITGTTLKQFPLPEISPTVAAELVQLGRSRIEFGAITATDRIGEIQAVELQINQLAASVFSDNGQLTTDN